MNTFNELIYWFAELIDNELIDSFYTYLLSTQSIIVAVFGLSSSLPPLVGGGGGLVYESVGKADLLSDHFDGKQSRESVDLQLTYHPSPRITSCAFRSSEVRRLLLDLDP